jgi:ParB family transcriptional regulator, chromosome partitioning protein
MTDDEREKAENWLRDHFEAGKQLKDIGRTVINGMRTGRFSTDGEGALALVALLNGAEGGVQFDMLNIFGAVK